ncbi:MAG TPA: mechanosensitive ion channel, partial [Myxococcota bacterium]|nr:mechanosensitive ion channel [Myxococcota bacterium]
AGAVVATRRIAKLLVWLFALAMAYPYLPGAQTEAFRGLSVLVGLMVSLGASSLVGQAASGLILTYGRVYRKGEYVRVGEHEGTVMDLGVFATRLRTGLGEELTLSNAAVLAAIQRGESYQLLVTDLSMPEMDGVELHLALRARGIRLPVLFCSGYSERAVSVPTGIDVDFLQKPVAMRTLAQRVRRLLNYSLPRT